MSNPDLFLIKDDIKNPKLKFQSDESNESLSSSSSSNSHSQDKKEEINSSCNRIVLTKQGDSDQSSSVLIPSSSGEKLLKVEDEEDGFRTPTSMDHRISVPKVCPPPPRKIKPSLKRKAPYNHCNCRHPLDLSKEVELLFPTTKKVRSLQEPK